MKHSISWAALNRPKEPGLVAQAVGLVITMAILYVLLVAAMS